MDNSQQSAQQSQLPGYYDSSPAYPPVIQQQPAPVMVNNTTYVVTQPSSLTTRPWTSGTCSCCVDISSCVCVTFCGPYYLCHVSKIMHEGCCMPCCMPPITSLAMLRLKLRTQEQIYGSISSDYCMSGCCWACVLCQLKRELDAVSARNNAGNQFRG